MRELTIYDVKAAVRGGSVYASGGGGWVDHGLEIGETAVRIGRPKLASIEELPEDAIIITVSAIGAPAAKDWQMLAADYIKAVRLLQENFNGRVVGVMTPQNGCSSSINGWVQAAALDLVVVDATGDMRAHPTAKMGSMGLAGRIDYETVQVVVGGRRETGSYLELVVKGSVAKTSNILRTASDQSGGFIACARHPLPASFIKKNAVLGGISRALTLGEAMIRAEKDGAEAVLGTICDTTGGRILGRGKVVSRELETKGAFDLGKYVVDTGEKLLTLHIMNEYMAVEDSEGNRLTTYPDVITTLFLKNGLPCSVWEVQEGTELAVFSIDKNLIPLSTSVMDASVYPEVEEKLGINLASYALAK